MQSEARLRCSSNFHFASPVAGIVLRHPMGSLCSSCSLTAPHPSHLFLAQACSSQGTIAITEWLFMLNQMPVASATDLAPVLRSSNTEACRSAFCHHKTCRLQCQPSLGVWTLLAAAVMTVSSCLMRSATPVPAWSLGLLHEVKLPPT